MAIRLLVLAALVGSAFSAQAQSTGTNSLQTYMPRAVEGYFMFFAPSAPLTAPVVLVDSGQSAAAASSASLQVQAPPASVAPAIAAATLPATSPSASLVAQAPLASVAPATEPALQQTTAPSALTAPAPVDAGLAELVNAGILADIAAQTDISSDAHAALTGGAAVNAALAPTVLLALEANAVPEPGTSGLMLAGLAGVGFMARRRRSR